jgi:hypothetical protein
MSHLSIDNTMCSDKMSIYYWFLNIVIELETAATGVVGSMQAFRIPCVIVLTITMYPFCTEKSL